MSWRRGRAPARYWTHAEQRRRALRLDLLIMFIAGAALGLAVVYALGQ